MNDLESLLRSWVPRRPSPKIKPRLFAGGQEFAAHNDGSAAAMEPAPFRVGWLAPATITFLLACVLFNQHNAFVLSQSTNCGPLVAAALSNQSAAAWLPGSFQRSQNSLPVEAFEWTNGNGWASNNSSSSGLGKTN